MTATEKYSFIREVLLPLLHSLPADRSARWGKMNAQQMVEHLSDFFRLSAAQIQMPLVTPEEQLPRYRAFLHSDKPFRENTKVPVLPDEPLPVRHSSLPRALEELQESVQAFVTLFEQNPGFSSIHPVFGELNQADWIQLHYKHVTHHLRQFDLLPADTC